MDSSEFSSLKVALFWILPESYNLHKGLEKPLLLQFDGIEILHTWDGKPAESCNRQMPPNRRRQPKMPQNTLFCRLCRCGGTGIHAGFKNPFSFENVGSNGIIFHKPHFQPKNGDFDQYFPKILSNCIFRIAFLHDDGGCELQRIAFL